MGEFTISTSMTVFVWFVSIGIIAINLFIVGGFLVDEGNSSDGGSGWMYAGAGLGASFYLGFILFLLREDLQKLRQRAGSLFLMLGGYDFVVGGRARKQRVPSQDDGLFDFLETPDTVEGSAPSKPPLSGVWQDYAPVSVEPNQDRENGERADGFGGEGDGEIGQAGSRLRDAHRSVDNGDDARA